MLNKRCFSFLLFAFTVLIFDARVANACSCGAKPTVLDAYEGAGAVVIAKVISIEKAEKEDEDNLGADGIKSAKLVVQKVFKGKLKAGDEMTFGQGGGADCVWTFDEESIGDEILFYAGTPEKNQKLWYAGTCGRSRGAQYAIDDLLYLNNLKKVQGKTRISGTIGFGFREDPDWSVGNRTVHIIGNNKIHKLKTDENGVYEIYGLPAGRYFVAPEMPKGWKLGRYWLAYSPSFAGDEGTTITNKIPIMLEAKKHAALDIGFEIDNAIRGKVYDANGKAMEGVCVKAVLPQNEKESGYHVDCTDQTGSFAITEISPGSYSLVVNDDDKISSKEPFRKFYYPNVKDSKNATVISIGAGDFIEDINIHVLIMEKVITIEGTLLYSDGKPVADKNIQFAPEKTNENIEGKISVRTDSSGRFSIKILKGLTGELYGDMYTYIGEFENCPKHESLIKKTNQTYAEIKTPVIVINAENDLSNVELRFPFPGCKKAKQE
jgi:hypothetical protein